MVSIGVKESIVNHKYLSIVELIITNTCPWNTIWPDVVESWALIYGEFFVSKLLGKEIDLHVLSCELDWHKDLHERQAHKC